MVLECFWSGFGVVLECFWSGFGVVWEWFWSVFGVVLEDVKENDRTGRHLWARGGPGSRQSMLCKAMFLPVKKGTFDSPVLQPGGGGVLNTCVHNTTLQDSRDDV